MGTRLYKCTIWIQHKDPWLACVRDEKFHIKCLRCHSGNAAKGALARGCGRKANIRMVRNAWVVMRSEASENESRINLMIEAFWQLTWMLKPHDVPLNDVWLDRPGTLRSSNSPPFPSAVRRRFHAPRRWIHACAHQWASSDAKTSTIFLLMHSVLKSKLPYFEQ